MGLQTYRQKRKFDKTPEPRGKEAHAQGALRFVVQKHRASQLHYDFRLELDGTLKSWAVPKGPSMNPADKRLAIMVEDHPLEYRTFEGIIPEGNYGAGTVMVWDAGTYHDKASTDPKESERLLRKGLEKGHLAFDIHGKKLKGAFSLVRLKKGEKNAWLLIKSSDEHSTTDDVTEQDRSVVSRQKMDRIARDALRKGKVWGTDGGEETALEPLLEEAPRSKMPHAVKPMLATLVDEPFDRAGWIFEPKWDGYRAIAEVEKKGVKLYSRNQKSFEVKFAPVAGALKELGHGAVLDGEVVIVDAHGKSHFQLLQNYQKTGEGELLYYVFDLLYLDGHDLRGLPLVRRKEILGQVLGTTGTVRLSEHIEETGKALFRAAEAHDLEGIIAKNGQSLYREGVRGADWLKIKTHRRQEAVVGGFTDPKGGRKDLGSLILGVYEGDELVYIGHSGGGFSAKDLGEIRKKLEPLTRATCPFREKPRTNSPAHWVEPRLVCEVSFQEWTDSGTMRHPIFVGFREDKPAREVHREMPKPVSKATKSEKMPRRTPKSKKAAARPENNVHQISGDEPRVQLTHLDKIYWPEEKYTKGDLISYYRDIAPLILPYLRDRPESLHRHPNGIDGDSFFQKDVSHQPPPDWVRTVGVPSGSNGKKVRYVVCQDEDTLLYMANLGCIELNPWNSRVGSLEKPDWLVVDLDPESIAFSKVVQAALAVRRVLDKAGAQSVCKTSGKTGLHIYVPLAARYTHEQAKQFAEIVANVVNQELPEATSVIRSPAKRQQKVYLDFLQNNKGQTLAAPYSVRPARGAPVSTPLKWSEVKSSLDPSRFTIRAILKRIDKLGDLWTPTLGDGIDLEACLERLNRLMSTAEPRTSAPRRSAKPKRAATRRG